MCKVVKIGSSLGIIIPRPLLNGYAFERGDQLVFVMATDKMLGIRALTHQERKLLREQRPAIDLSK